MATDAILTLDAVIAGYGKMTILHGTTLAVPRGAITTVIGPNGAGKSTVFKTVFGMLPARSGRILFEGVEITNFTPRALLAHRRAGGGTRDRARRSRHRAARPQGDRGLSWPLTQSSHCRMSLPATAR